eukprot:4569601-Amphidinium_carterae.4
MDLEWEHRSSLQHLLLGPPSKSNAQAVYDLLALCVHRLELQERSGRLKAWKVNVRTDPSAASNWINPKLQKQSAAQHYRHMVLKVQNRLTVDPVKQAAELSEFGIPFSASIVIDLLLLLLLLLFVIFSVI